MSYSTHLLLLLLRLPEAGAGLQPWAHTGNLIWRGSLWKNKKICSYFGEYYGSASLFDSLSVNVWLRLRLQCAHRSVFSPLSQNKHRICYVFLWEKDISARVQAGTVLCAQIKLLLTVCFILKSKVFFKRNRCLFMANLKCAFFVLTALLFYLSSTRTHFQGSIFSWLNWRTERRIWL